MIDTKTLRKSRIEFIDKEGKVLKSDYFDKLLTVEGINIDEKWFLRGCKQVAERHYTEAIKRFQLSKSDDARLMILASTFKVADKFLFEEYYTENLSNFVYFTKYEFYPYFVIEEEKHQINQEFIKKLKELF